MKEYSVIRWNRLKELYIDFTYVKMIVKNKYGYQIKENSLDEFISNISSYKEINEKNLLDLLENETYKKAMVFSIIKYKKNKDKMPIIDDINSVLLTELFKEINDINFDNGKYYDGELSEFFRVTYFNKNNEFAVIKMSCILNENSQIHNEGGYIEEIDKQLYDCCKFVIDLTKKIVIMCYNDVNSSKINTSTQITIKKTAFRNLFAISNKNILKYDLSRNLMKYFNEYIEEIKNNDIHKLISIIQASTCEINSLEKSLIRSVKHNFVHSNKRLDAIIDAIENEHLIISEIQSCIDDVEINVHMKGEIFCINSFFYKEVAENVCKEFFYGYEVFKQEL